MDGKVMAFNVKGMTRDSSRSKFSPEYSYENKNIRIVSHGDGTLMSVTNQKGQSKITINDKGNPTFNLRVRVVVTENITPPEPLERIPFRINVFEEVADEPRLYDIRMRVFVSGNDASPEPPPETPESIEFRINVSEIVQEQETKGDFDNSFSEDFNIY